MARILTLLITLLTTHLWAQDAADPVMERRAREFHRVIGLSDKDAYKKFMVENYTKEFLERPVKARKVVAESDGNTASTTNESKPIDNMQAKIQMYAQLHDDFAGSSISSLTRTDNKIEMLVKSVGLKGKFTFTFNKEKPYLIDGLGIQADMEN